LGFELATTGEFGDFLVALKSFSAVILTSLLVPALASPALATAELVSTPQPTCEQLAAEKPDDFPARLCASMSLEEKLAQMIISYPPLDKEAPVTVGAVILLGPLLRNANTLRARVADLQRRSKIPLLVAVDMEGGRLNRLQFIPALKGAPSGRALGAMSEADAEEWGRTLGREMRALGLNCNLGPVLDLADRGLMYESERSMGSDTEAVVRNASAYARGMRSQGIVPIGKHFPGYGPLAESSDFNLVVTDRSPEEIEQHAEVFFDVGGLLGGVMLANVGYRAYGGQPAILSPQLVSLAHRDNRGWVTMTDDLAVKTLSEATAGDQEEVVRRAFLAGNDFLLTTAPVDWDKGIDLRRLMLERVKAQPELLGRVDASVLRILRLKEKAGLLEKLRRPPRLSGDGNPIRTSRDLPANPQL
jgi:beta-N-acetylhexosaminidase